MPRELKMFFLVLFVFMVIMIMACAHERKPECTWVCEPNGRPPWGCYCIEDEIQEEFSK